VLLTLLNDARAVDGAPRARSFVRLALCLAALAVGLNCAVILTTYFALDTLSGVQAPLALVASEIRATHLPWVFGLGMGLLVFIPASISLLHRAGSLLRRDASRARRALEESERRLARLTRNVPGVLYQYLRGPDGRRQVTFVSESVERVLGVPQARCMEDLGALWGAVHPDDRASLAAAEARAAGRLEAWRWEGRLAGDQGETRWVQIAARPDALREGGMLWDSVLLDVTERRRLEEQLLIKDRMASLGQLAAGVAHEINNPLAFMSVNLQFVLGELAEPDRGDRLDDVAEALQDVNAGIERVRGIVGDMKSLSQVQEAACVPVDLEAVLQAAAGVAANGLKTRARMLWACERTPPGAGDAARLGQVFLNLLINSAQALPEGGAAQHHVRIATWLEDGRVIAEVSDTGPGIPAHALSHIFNPFFTTKPVGQGTGLGLSICHSIVAAHGGSITAESGPGTGAIFRVALPVWEGDAPEGEPPRGAAAQPRRLRLLFIDDEPALLRAVERLLADHEVLCAGSRRAGLEQVTSPRGADYDRIFCALEMGDGGARAIYQAASPPLRERFVFMTSGDPEAALEAAPEAAWLPLLEKPFDAEALWEILQATPSDALDRG